MFMLSIPALSVAQTPENNQMGRKKTSGSPMLAHLVLQVSDPEASLKFYQEFLDMELSEKSAANSRNRFFLTNSGSHHKLVLMENKNLPDTSQRILQQIAFEVPDHPTLVQYYKRIKNKTKTELKDNQISWSVYFYDPDQNKIEIFLDTRNKPFGQEKWQGQTKPLPEETLLRGNP